MEVKTLASELKKWGELLALIGCIICLIVGILDLLFALIPGWLFILPSTGIGLGVWFPGFEIIAAILLIIFSIIGLATCGVIKFPIKFDKNWIWLLILGILLLVFGGIWGAWLVIIGAILLLVNDMS